MFAVPIKGENVYPWSSCVDVSLRERERERVRDSGRKRERVCVCVNAWIKVEQKRIFEQNQFFWVKTIKLFYRRN